MFCSDECSHRYYSLLNARKKNDNKEPPRFCKNCGRVLLRGTTDYCSPECRGRREHHEYQIEGINALRFALLRQAKAEKQLEHWMRSKSFYQWFPELTPEQVKGVRQ